MTETRPEVMHILLNRSLHILETDETLLKAREEELEEALYILKEERGGRNTTRIRMLEKERSFRKKPPKKIGRKLCRWERDFVHDWNEIQAAAARIKEAGNVL